MSRNKVGKYQQKQIGQSVMMVSGRKKPAAKRAPTKPHHVFVSYARSNEVAVQTIVSRLRGWGYRLWLDQYDIAAGADWRKRIAEAIRQADAFLLMISRTAVTSRMVNWELGVAEENKVQVIPVVLQATKLPRSLSRRLDGLNQISFTKDRYRGSTKLVEALGGIRGGIPRIPGDTRYPALRENSRVIVEIIRFLQDVMPEGGNAIFTGGTDWDYYVQLAISPGEAEVYGEAVGNLNLTRTRRLNGRQIEKLAALGWEAPNKKSSGNFHRTWQVRLDTDRALVAGEMMRTFLEVYNHMVGDSLGTEVQTSGNTR